MKHKNYFMYGLALLASVIVLYAIVSLAESPAIALLFTKTSGKEISLQTIITGTTEEGDVAIGITPKIINRKVILFTEINTHSIDLGQFDLSQRVVLQLNGKSIKPSSTFTPQRHHASGEVKFNVEDYPEEFTVIITGIPKLEQRTYQWEVKL